MYKVELSRLGLAKGVFEWILQVTGATISVERFRTAVATQFFVNSTIGLLSVTVLEQQGKQSVILLRHIRGSLGTRVKRCPGLVDAFVMLRVGG